MSTSTIIKNPIDDSRQLVVYTAGAYTTLVIERRETAIGITVPTEVLGAAVAPTGDTETAVAAGEVIAIPRADLPAVERLPDGRVKVGDERPATAGDKPSGWWRERALRNLAIAEFLEAEAAAAKTDPVAESAELLNSLPEDAVVLDVDGNAWQKDGDGDWARAGLLEAHPGTDIADCGPFTVLQAVAE